MKGLPLPSQYGVRSIPDLLERSVERDSAALAVTGRTSSTADPVALTRGELRTHAMAAAGGLRDRGIGPGDRVAWLLDNDDGLDALVLYHAVAAVGAVNVPVNTRLAPAEIAQQVALSESRVVVASPRHEDRFAAIRADGPARLVVLDGRTTLGGLLTSNTEPPHRATDIDIANLLYTSGTTGLPKGVVHTHGSSLAAAISWSDAFRLTPDDVLQSPFPVFSGAGLHFNALSCLWAGAHVVIDDVDIDTSLASMRHTRPTVFVAVPSIYAYWLDSAALADADLGSLRILDYGGASMPPATIERLRRVAPSAGLMQTYGLTEAGPGGTYLPEEYALARLGSIGSRCAGPFTQVRVVDDDGRDVGSGDLGELLLRGPSVMDGYFREPTATAAAFTGEWLRTGDVVRFDDDGFLFHVDRRKDLIVRGGYNVASVEVEAVLATHPAVREAAVFGVPHQHLGEDVSAVVVPRAGASIDGDELIAHCRRVLADFKCPRRVITLDSLPRNASGKVDKQRLRAEHTT